MTRALTDTAAIAGFLAVAFLLPSVGAIWIPGAFIAGWLLASVIVLLFASRAKSRAVRAVGAVVFGLTFALFICETALTVAGLASSEPVNVAGNFGSSNHFVRDAELGYAMRPAIQVASRAPTGTRSVHDVRYSISSAGFRVTRNDKRGKTWVFMGCSFIFGEGVNDTETLPAHFSRSLGHDAKVVNMGVPGYGSHQVLRALETNRLRAHHPVTHVFYLGMMGHVFRSAGRSDWDPGGPRYRLSGDSVVFDGPFHGPRVARAILVGQRSKVIAHLAHRLYYDRKLSDQEIELYVRTVERAALIARRNVGAPFTVIFWDQPDRQSQRVLSRLRRTGLQIVLVSTILADGPPFVVGIPGDGHPTPEAYRRVAIGLVAAVM